ncbi:MAG: cytochrome P450 [Hyphomonadaceae bacterium]|nr:cytochrome P450 [Hyphomonadaceae bacterium]
MADETPPPILQLTPLNPAFRDDPHALYRRLRESHSVYRDDVAGSHVITRYRLAREVLNDRTMLRGPDKVDPPGPFNQRLMESFDTDPETGERRTYSILLMDEPHHSRVRPPIAKALYARAAKCKPLVDDIIDEKLSAVEPRGGFDVLSDFSIPLPIDVIGAILGVDIERRGEFREWSEGVIQGLNPFRTPDQQAYLERSGEAIRAYFEQQIADRRVRPRDDLISDVVALQAEGAELKDPEIISNLIGLLVGGNLTTSDLIGNGVYALLTHPEELAKLKADPSIVSQVVEEILRFDGPVDITARVTPKDMEIGGCPVKARQSVISLLRSANHDPDIFENPDAFDVSRKPGPHVAFGGGSHICIGAPLARIEAQAALSKLFQRFPNLRLARPEEKPEKRTLPFFNGLQRLDVLI